MSDKRDFNETNVEDANPFASPEAVAETNDGWEFVDAPPTVGPSFRGAFWYCLRRPFDFKGRANRTEYFGWLAGLFVALSTLGFVAGLGTPSPFAWARATKGIPLLFLCCGFAFACAAAVPGAAVWTRRQRDRNVGASWKTALGGGVAMLAAAGVVAVGVGIIDAFNWEPNEIQGMVWGAATGLLFLASTSTVAWGPTIWTFGFGVAKLGTTPEQASDAEKVVAVIAMTSLLASLGILIRVFTCCRAGTPGPNRFGAERLTPKEAARRERAKTKAEDAATERGA